MLNVWGACSDGIDLFLKHFPIGEADYQDMLDALAEADMYSNAHWLMNHAGPTKEVREVDEINTENHVFFAGSLVVKRGINAKDIRAGGEIKAGWGIVADWDIKVCLGIKAGHNIVAGRGIKAGWDIVAGHEIKADNGINAKNIVAGEGIKAGEDIVAGHDIVAGKGVVAGRGIVAGSSIRCGIDWGIYAGVELNLSRQRSYGIVHAKELSGKVMYGLFEKVE